MKACPFMSGLSRSNSTTSPQSPCSTFHHNLNHHQPPIRPVPPICLSCNRIRTYHQSTLFTFPLSHLSVSAFLLLFLTLLASTQSAIPSTFSSSVVHVADIRIKSSLSNQSSSFKSRGEGNPGNAAKLSLNDRLRKRWRSNSVESFFTHISFEALNRTFNLKVWPKDISAEHPQLTIQMINESNQVLQTDYSLLNISSTFLAGVDLDQPHSSKVRFYIDQSSFITGSISYDNSETVHIEPLWRHKEKERDLSVKESCSMVVYYGMGSLSDRMKFWEPEEEEDLEQSETINDREPQKQKRVPRSAYLPAITNIRCPLLLVADFKFFNKMGNSNFETTASYLIGLIDRINHLFINTDFSFVDEEMNERVEITGVGFEIKRIIIHTKASLDSSHYNANRKWTVQDLLSAFSMERYNNVGGGNSFSHADYCLCHLFTYEDLEEGVMGMAYRAVPHEDHGVCAGSTMGLYVSDSAQSTRTTQTVLNYRNTGITTLYNWGAPILTQAADLVTGHELGHNFGSNHDPPECQPSADKGGHYLMNARAVGGLQRNNRYFSPCSRTQIGRILVTRASLCFVAARDGDSGGSGGICGNSKVDPGEACDEGRFLLKNDPLHSGSGASVNGSLSEYGRCCNDNCQLIGDFECSNINHKCCRDCYFAPPGQQCYQSAELSCTKSATCTGYSGQCPEGNHEPDGTECLNHGVCNNGECKSYCHSIGFEPCECSSLDVPYLLSDSSSPFHSRSRGHDSTDSSSPPTTGPGRTPSPQCVLCCQQVAINGSLEGQCRPVADIVGERLVDYYVYPDHTMCTGGSCQQGRCVSSMHNDIFSYVFSAFRGRNIWQNLLRLFKQNAVLSIVFISLLIYMPVCLMLHFCIDRPILKLNKKTTNSYIRKRVFDERPRENPPKSPSPLSDMEAPIYGFFHRLNSQSSDERYCNLNDIQSQESAI